MVFQPGQSGNPSGLSNRKPFSDAIGLELAMLASGRVDKVPKLSLRAAIRAQIQRAADGDLQSLNWLAERTEGKPKTIVSGDADQPINVQVSRGLDAQAYIMDQLRQIGDRGREIALAAVTDDTSED
jgi:Family of unknown function (DUF5681)